MGCIILIAVSHADLEKVRSADFAQVERLITLSDVHPKRFDSGVEQGWNKTSRFQCNLPGIAVSHYYDFEDRMPLLVTSDFIISPRMTSWCRNSKMQGLADIASDMNLMLKHRKLCLESDLEAFRAPVKGTKVSLFCLYLDAVTGLLKNPHVMDDIVEFCQTGHANHRTFSDPSVIGFTALGTLNENQNAFIFPKGYRFEVAPITKREIAFSQAEIEQINAFYQSDMYEGGLRHDVFEGTKLFNDVLLREMAAGASYAIRPLIKKRKKSA
jgi:hypothetical protein